MSPKKSLEPKRHESSNTNKENRDSDDERTDNSDDMDSSFRKFPGKTIKITSPPIPHEIVEVPEPQNQLPQTTPQKKQFGMFLDDGSFNMEGFYDLLGSDIRRKILSKLAKFPRYASNFTIDLSITKQAVKKHLDKLVDFGLVQEIKERIGDQKIQLYEINPDIALFPQVDLTPNYFKTNAQNFPDALTESLKSLQHDPAQAMTLSRKDDTDFDELNMALKVLGQQLFDIENKIENVESARQKVLLDKTVLLNRLQMIINALVENDLEKEAIFSLFFDINSTIDGLSVQDILNQMFLLRKTRAGISKDLSEKKVDERTQERGQKLLKLLQLLLENLRFMQTENRRIFFDFGS